MRERERRKKESEKMTLFFHYTEVKCGVNKEVEILHASIAFIKARKASPSPPTNTAASPEKVKHYLQYAKNTVLGHFTSQIASESILEDLNSHIFWRGIPPSPPRQHSPQTQILARGRLVRLFLTTMPSSLSPRSYADRATKKRMAVTSSKQ